MVSNFLWYFSVKIYIYISMVSNCLWYFGVKNIAWLFLISSGTNAFLTVMTKTEEIFKFCWSYEIKLGNLFRAFCSRARCKLLSKCDNDSEFWLLGGNDWYCAYVSEKLSCICHVSKVISQCHSWEKSLKEEVVLLHILAQMSSKKMVDTCCLWGSNSCPHNLICIGTFFNVITIFFLDWVITVC